MDVQAGPSPLVGQFSIRPEERPGLVPEQSVCVPVAGIESDPMSDGEPVRGDLTEERSEPTVEVQRVCGSLNDVVLDALELTETR